MTNYTYILMVLDGGSQVNIGGLTRGQALQMYNLLGSGRIRSIWRIDSEGINLPELIDPMDM
jgi:hypothetical protein